ncbi:MAG: cytochrome b5 domain-containing protein [Candidatus Kerfeldbacteria bacterium]|nr:cytochrome b5 domain-containing protein [Candidatus Kerfeldbacteria bacterium]
MKSELLFGTIGVLIIIIISIAIWTGYPYLQIGTPTTNTTTNGALTNKTTQTPSGMEILAQHNTIEDCWLLISGKIYGVSSYLATHPGGRDVIAPYCGKDATTAFSTKDGRGTTHSSFAVSELARFYLGTLESITPTTTQNNNVNTETPATNTAAQPSAATPTTTGTSVTLDTATVARHNSAGDCWIIISNTVYAVTNYLNAHPGGRAIIIPYCGRDATSAFSTKAGQGSHSSNARSQLANYAIGTLNSTTTTETIQTTEQQINSQTPPASSGNDDGGYEYEDD